MQNTFFVLGILAILFIAFPYVIFSFITKWKTTATITTEDENLLDELHDLARRLDDRMLTIERIIQAENPNWRQLGNDPVETALEDRSERLHDLGSRDRDYAPSGRSNRPARRS